VGLGQVKKRDDEPTAAHTLYNLLDRRHTRASTAITSNIKLSAWGRDLGDATNAPETTGLAELAHVAASRHSVEQCFEEAKNDFGTRTSPRMQSGRSGPGERLAPRTIPELRRLLILLLLLAPGSVAFKLA
jgi:hypothetical protein